jgi:hypothetical protein
MTGLLMAKLIAWRFAKLEPIALLGVFTVVEDIREVEE